MASTVARKPVEAPTRGSTGSPAALSASITSAAVEKEILGFSEFFRGKNVENYLICSSKVVGLR
jgi:hypothetical protein